MYWKRESTHASQGEAEGESQAGSAVSTEPNMGLDTGIGPTNHEISEIMTWAKIKSRTLNQLSHLGAPMS